MLGWDVLVFRGEPGRPSAGTAPKPMIRFATGLGGIGWIRELVAQGKAVEVATNGGYPWQFRVPARHLLAALAHGLPARQGPLVIGDDFVQPAGWNGTLEMDADELSRCDPDESLEIEAWDQS